MWKSVYLITWLLLLTTLNLAACNGATRGQSQPQDKHGDGQAQEALVKNAKGNPVAGKEKFTTTCSACHGQAGEGISGLGKDMRASQFIAGKTDTELVEFIKIGRNPGDPLNTTGVAMPPKGGNPTLSDEDLTDIVAYIRALQQK
jgi:disulfide bond formation protein DsbB